MPSKIRPATEVDLPRIVELLAQLSPDDPDREDTSSPLPYNYHLVFREMAQGRQRLLVAESRRKIVGTLVLVVVPNLSHKGTPYGIIENVVVDEKYRSKGIGEALITRAVDEARKVGCYKVTLTSNRRRTEAHRFYERLGFARTHEAFRINLV
ncbi:MAG: GNAT family N-acetyltransferase [Chloroflexota bacterium]